MVPSSSIRRSEAGRGSTGEITKYVTLQPGDVLWMGTEGHADPIRAGDTVDIEITGIGTLSNPVVAGAFGRDRSADPGR